MVGLDGAYKGLTFGHSTSIYFDDQAVIVRPEIAQAQIEALRHDRESTPTAPVFPPPAPDGRSSAPVEPPMPRLTTRYHGPVSLDPQRVNREMATIVEEIIQRLTSLTGTNVEITLEVSAERTAGFDDSTVRTINENSRTLKFRNHGFEAE